MEGHARIHPVGMIVGMGFVVLALVLFNLFVDRRGIVHVQPDQGWRVMPMLSSEALKAYLPLWNLGWGLTLALNLPARSVESLHPFTGARAEGFLHLHPGAHDQQRGAVGAFTLSAHCPKLIPVLSHNGFTATQIPVTIEV